MLQVAIMSTSDRSLAFDRGTLIFRGHWPPEIATLPRILLDPRVGSLRAPAFAWNDIIRLLGERGLGFENVVRSAQRPSGKWSPVELRPYQETALRSWEVANKRGLVILPTGAGKTRVAIAAIARHGGSALCIVPTRVLLEQWRHELRRFYEGPIGCYGDGARELAPITVATFESAWRHMAEFGNRFDLLVVDEAHHFGANVRDEALEMAIAPARLALSATPVRDGPAAARIVELLGPVVYELGIGDLAGTFLANFDLLVLGLELTPDERRFYEVDIAKFRVVQTRFWQTAPGASWGEFVRAASSSAEGREALAAWRRVRRLLACTHAKSEAIATLLTKHRDAKVLVFTADNETAYAVSRRLLVMPLTCDIGRDERDDALRAFREGRLRALVSARVLNEGLDVPDADVAIVVGGALGTREHVQRVGRLLRPAPGKRATVYELVSRNTIEVGQARRRREGLAARITAPV
ncbi:MAG TPA: DEAD/DEAH box helicase family protein [Planctomycetota bacterium]|nr:DEAD/DEAH box helicase family protein [Planctomycetota bacterium]